MLDMPKRTFEDESLEIIAFKISDLRKDWSKIRTKLYLSGAAVAVTCALVFAVVLKELGPPGLVGNWHLYGLSMENPLFLISVMIATVVWAIFSSQKNAIKTDLELWEAKQRIAREFNSRGKRGSNSNSYFDSLVRINIENLADYYSLVKIHTHNSFISSLVAAAFGFVFILIGVAISLIKSDGITPAFLATSSGILIEAISGIFFYLYNRTVIQLKEYHDSLLSVQNVLLSLKLVNDTEDSSAKSSMIARTCEVLLAGVEPSKTTAKVDRSSATG